MPATTAQGGVRGTQIHNGSFASIIAAAETNQLKTGSGTLGRVFVTNVGAGATLDIYDHQSTTTNKVAEWVTADGKVNWELNVPFSNGLRVITAGSTACRAVVVWI